jgi:DNA-binding CsgD family transcriptional regulator
VLLGRQREREFIDRLVEGALRGNGGILLVTGEPGIGKTTLLDDAIERWAGTGTPLRAAGREPDLDLPFGCLTDLLRPADGAFADIPPAQEHALRHALGYERTDAAVDLLSVGVALLGVLDALSRRSPLLVTIDDLQWVDPSSRAAVLFAARRLDELRVATLLAGRTGAIPEAEVGDVPRLELEGLRRRDAATLLSRSTDAPLDASVQRRLLEACQGNPLALLELPATLSDEQLAGVDPLGEPIPVNGGIERAFGGRIARLPGRTRSALLSLAAAGSDTGGVVAAALRRSGLDQRDLEPAEREGLVVLGPDGRSFRHPLIRSVAYHGRPEHERRAAHTNLAEVEGDADRRAWHLYAAAAGTDEVAAAELDAAGSRALARGAPASAARAFEAAARLTGRSEARARRLSGAARAAHRAGDVDGARRFSAAAGDLTSDPVTVADLLLVESDLRMRDGDLEGAHRALVAQAEELVSVDRRRAATMLLVASKLRIYRLEARVAADEVERALGLLPAEERDVVHLSALGMSRTVAGREGARDAVLASAAAAAQAPHGHAHTLAIAWPLIWLEEYGLARTVIERALAIQREAGFLLYLPQALLALAELDFRTGEWNSAFASGAEALQLFHETGQPSEAAWAAAVLCRMEAARGNGDACRALSQQALGSDVEFGLRSSSAHALAAMGLLALGDRRPEDAIGPLEVSGRIAALGVVGEPWLLLSKPDLVEALARTGAEARAAEALSDFEKQLGGHRRVSALAAAARCAGIIATGTAWRDDFERALALHEQVPTPFERARTELCYGERLRRARRRSEARGRLRDALETFESLGAAPWAQRARVELSASGERIRPRSAPFDTLTPQERAVARLVSDGLRNREVAANLFVSEKTVEFHLAGVYRKLGIRSRVALARLVAGSGR